MPERDLAEEIVQLILRVTRLEIWREQLDRDLGGLSGRVGRLEKQVDEIVKAEEFASRLAVELGKRRSQMFSRGEKLAALSIAAAGWGVALASLIVQVTH